MSNKDVEVEECRHYLENYYCYDNEFTNLIQINACGLTREGYHELHYKKCSDNPNCYFKQLQRKEDENKQLREAITNFIKHSEKWICTKECKQKCNIDCSVNKFKQVLKEE